MQRTGRRKPPATKKRKQFYIGSITFFILTLYLAGYAITSLSKPKLSVEVARYGSIDTIEDYQGIIIRDEVLVKSKNEGMAFFSCSDNEYVRKGSLVCTVKDVKSTATIEEKISGFNNDIMKIQEDRGYLSMFAEDVEYRNEKISEIIDKSTFSFNQTKDIYKIKAALQKEMDLRNQILLSDSGSPVKNLMDERTIYQKSLSGSMQTYVSEKNGIMTTALDGLEETVTLEKLESLTEHQTNMSPAAISLYNMDKEVKNGDPLFKIVASNDWFIAAYLPKKETEGWKSGQGVKLFLNSETGDDYIDANIHFISSGNSKDYVVFKTNKYMLDFLNTRNVSFRLKDKKQEGIKIPNSAILEETMLQIPTKWITEERSIKGVLKKSESGFLFVPISISYVDKDTAFVALAFGTLAVGDTIYTKDSNGKETGSFQITKTKSDKGVFVVNSGFPEFKSIKIIASNDYYSIINTDNSYSIKPYDRIISDASTLDKDF